MDSSNDDLGIELDAHSSHSNNIQYHKENPLDRMQNQIVDDESEGDNEMDNSTAPTERK